MTFFFPLIPGSKPRTEIWRRGGQKERRGTSFGKGLPDDNIE